MRVPTPILWAAAIGGAAALIAVLAPTYAFADEPMCESYKDCVPQHEEERWHRPRAKAYLYNEQRYYNPKPKREQTYDDYYRRQASKETRYIGEEGQPLYRNDKIEEMCLKLANKGLQGTVTFYDLKYRRNVCDFNQDYYTLNRYKYGQ